MLSGGNYILLGFDAEFKEQGVPSALPICFLPDCFLPDWPIQLPFWIRLLTIGLGGVFTLD